VDEKKSSTDSPGVPPPGGDGPRDDSAAEPFPRHRLPFSGWWPLLAGVLAGLALRLLFSGKPGGPYAAMMAAFIYLSPLIVGAVTVYVAERRQRRSWAYYFWAPFLANILYVLGTLLVMIEGLVCAVIIAPLFAALGALGGLIMGLVCRVTNWPKRALYSVAILPLVLGAAETNVPLPDQIGAVERAVVIDATPDQIWRQLLNAENIRPEEVDRAWLFRIGVPVPLAGTTRETPEGLSRRVTMGKGIYFDQVSTDWKENRHVRWTYRFYADSFPAYALDEHVVIGGHYFDLKETSYTLTPQGKYTELRVRMQYRVSTRFNWYADPVARALFRNLEEVNLEYYRRRSEALRDAHPPLPDRR
jgi:hypothetical protein